MVHRRILTLALVALMLPGLILARGATWSVCLCSGPLGGVVDLVGGTDCCAPDSGGGCCELDEPTARASCCEREAPGRGERRRDDGPRVGPQPCGGCTAFAVDAVDLTFESHASGDRRGVEDPSVHGAPAPPAPGPTPRITLGAVSERAPPADRLERTTPAALRRGDRPMRN